MGDQDCWSVIRMNGRGESTGTDGPCHLALAGADRLAAVGQLAGGLAHEMNTPLGSISAHAEECLELLWQLRDNRLPADKQADLAGRLGAIMHQAQRCSSIASRLLQFADPVRSTRRACAPDATIDHVIGLFGPAARSKGVRIERLVEPKLPPVPVDRAELEQVLVNLLQNSLDACASGAVISVRAAHADGALEILVADTGCGIARQHLARVFDPFYTTKPIGRGTGLGLSVCLGIVRSTGGTIEIRSAVLRGTQVRVRIPPEQPAGTRACRTAADRAP